MKDLSKKYEEALAKIGKDPEIYGNADGIYAAAAILVLSKTVEDGLAQVDETLRNMSLAIIQK